MNSCWVGKKACGLCFLSTNELLKGKRRNNKIGRLGGQKALFGALVGQGNMCFGMFVDHG